MMVGKQCKESVDEPEEGDVLCELLQLVGGHVQDADAVLQAPHLQHLF